ncbi:cupin domain-containing protein [Streptomyces sp. AF1A]|uniref:cupin domain-containing protein n=1 Tax=Streptomyces sp. AF1A TaxID=3394350 RepID=UPI0039BC98AF
MLTGTLRLTLGDQDFQLHAGEAAEFDSRTPHGLANVGGRPLELLIIFSLQGEPVHMRAPTT